MILPFGEYLSSVSIMHNQFFYPLVAVFLVLGRLSDDILVCHATGNFHLLWFESFLSHPFEGIIAHATYDISAAKIEGINNKIQKLCRQGYGYLDADRVTAILTISTSS